jgi:hypothetical protein
MDGRKQNGENTVYDRALLQTGRSHHGLASEGQSRRPQAATGTLQHLGKENGRVRVRAPVAGVRYIAKLTIAEALFSYRRAA